MVAPRDVVLLWDVWTRPEKEKLHVCICPRMQLFLRINTLEYFPPTHLLRAEENGFLNHDSYVELTQIVRHAAYEVGRAQVIGRLSNSESLKLVGAAERAPTLSEEHRRLIRERLG